MLFWKLNAVNLETYSIYIDIMCRRLLKMECFLGNYLDVNLRNICKGEHKHIRDTEIDLHRTVHENLVWISLKMKF